MENVFQHKQYKKQVIRSKMYLNFELYESCCRPPGEKIHKILIVDDSVLQATIPVSVICWLQFSKSSFLTSRSCESRYNSDVIQNNRHPPSTLTEFGVNSTTPQPAWKSSDWEFGRMKVKPNSSITKLASKSQHHQPITPVIHSWVITTAVDRHEKTDGLVCVMCLTVHTHRRHFCMR